MRLLVVRHGEYIAAEDNKPLSEKGIADIQRAASFLKAAGVNVGHFYHSGKTRAEQTAEIMKNTLNPFADLGEKKYLSPNDSTDNIVYDISGWDENAMVVGHLPFLSKLVSRLLTGTENKSLVSIPAGAVVILERYENAWYLVSFITPDLLGAA